MLVDFVQKLINKTENAGNILAPPERLSDLTMQGVNFFFIPKVRWYANGAFVAITVMKLWRRDATAAMEVQSDVKVEIPTLSQIKKYPFAILWSKPMGIPKSVS